MGKSMSASGMAMRRMTGAQIITHVETAEQLKVNIMCPAVM